MSLYKSITLYICKTECYECHKEYYAAYKKVEYDDSYPVHNKIDILSPQNFSDKEIEIAKENGVIIKKRGYNTAYPVDVFTVNVCPHCGTHIGNNHIKELMGKEIKEIVIRDNQK